MYLVKFKFANLKFQFHFLYAGMFWIFSINVWYSYVLSNTYICIHSLLSKSIIVMLLVSLMISRSLLSISFCALPSFQAISSFEHTTMDQMRIKIIADCFFKLMNTTKEFPMMMRIYEKKGRILTLVFPFEFWSKCRGMPPMVIF